MSDEEIYYKCFFCGKKAKFTIKELIEMKGRCPNCNNPIFVKMLPKNYRKVTRAR